MAKSFISYSSTDSQLIEGVVKILKTSGEVFRDKDSIKPGENWEEAIDTALKNTDQLFVFWCCHSGNSNMVKYELLKAIELKKKVIPILCCSYEVDKEIKSFQWIDMKEQFNHKCDSTLKHSDSTSKKGKKKEKILWIVRIVLFLFIAGLLLTKPFPVFFGTACSMVIHYTLTVFECLIALWSFFDYFTIVFRFEPKLYLIEKIGDSTSDFGIKILKKDGIKAKLLNALKKTDRNPFRYYPPSEK